MSSSGITVPDSFPQVCSGWRCHLHGAAHEAGGYWPRVGSARDSLRAASSCCSGPAGGESCPHARLAAVRALPSPRRAPGGLVATGGSTAAGRGSCRRWPHRVALRPAGLEQRLLHRVGDYADQRDSGEGEGAGPVRSQQGRARSRTGGAVGGRGRQRSGQPAPAVRFT